MTTAPVAEHKQVVRRQFGPQADREQRRSHYWSEAVTDRRNLIRDVTRLVKDAGLPSGKVRDFLKEAGDVDGAAHDDTKRRAYLECVKGLILAHQFGSTQPAKRIDSPLQPPAKDERTITAPVKPLKNASTFMQFDANVKDQAKRIGLPLYVESMTMRFDLYKEVFGCEPKDAPGAFTELFKQVVTRLEQKKATRPMADFDNFDKPQESTDVTTKPAEKTDERQHWIKVDTERSAFWKHVNGLKARHPNTRVLSQDEWRKLVHGLCGVDEHMDEFAGTREEAEATFDTAYDRLYPKSNGKPAKDSKQEPPAANGKPTKDEWKAWLDSNHLDANLVLRALHADSLKQGHGPVTKLSEWDGKLDDALAIVQAFKPEPAENGNGKNPPSEPQNGHSPDKGSIPQGNQNGQQAPNGAHGVNGNDTTVDKSTALVPVSPIPVANTGIAMLPMIAQWDLMRQQADVLIKSGFMPSAVNTPEKAIAIMMMGSALQIDPIVALNSINVILGKPTVSPQLMLALVRRSGQLDYIKISDDGTCCTVEMKRRNEPVHTEKFSQQDAATMGLAGKDNWKKQPAVMRKWRAVSAACRIVFPDVTWGIASYTTEEINPDVSITVDGELLEAA